MGKIIIIDVKGVYAVSYTHLDVYKRQAYTHVFSFRYDEICLHIPYRNIQKVFHE